MTSQTRSGSECRSCSSPSTMAQPSRSGVAVSGRRVTLKWSQSPVRYFISNQGVPGVTSSDLQAAVGRAFATWQAVPTASITYQLAGVIGMCRTRTPTAL